jgi:hypothetical protein
MFGIRTQSRLERQARAFVFLLVAVGACWLFASWIIGANTSTLYLGGLGLLAAALAVTILADWRAGVYLLIVWLLFEDLARKFLGNNMAIYFGKDVLAAVVYFSFAFYLRKAEHVTFRLPSLVPVAAFFALALIQVFNAASPSVTYGLLGLKLYFFYVPLAYLSYALVSDSRDLDRFLIFNSALAGLIALLGIIQAIVGLDFLNPQVMAPELEYLGRLTRYAPISGLAVPRPSSVFVSDARFAMYMLVMWIIGQGAAMYFVQRKHPAQKLAFLSLALIATAIIFSGSRGVFIYMMISSVVLGFVYLRSGFFHHFRSARLVVGLSRIFVVAVVALILAGLAFPSAVGARLAFYYETLAPDSPASELAWRGWQYPIQEIRKAFAYPLWLSGYGTGTASLGMQYVSRFFKVPLPEAAVESGIGNLVLEMGVLGPIFWFAWTIPLVVAGASVVRSLRKTDKFGLASALLWFMFFLLVVLCSVALTSYQNYVNNAYIWLVVGLLFRLPHLNDTERGAPAAASPVRWPYGR